MMTWREWFRSLLARLGFVSGPETAVRDSERHLPAPTAVPHSPPPAKPTKRDAAPISTFNLWLLDSGPDGESVSHLLQELTGCSLREARQFAAAAPVQLWQQIDAHTGRAIQKRLAALGAVCELRDDGGATAQSNENLALDGDESMPSSPGHPDNTFFLFGDFNVVLREMGAQPSQVIQILGDLLSGRSLDEVAEMVANVPQTVIHEVPWETAETIQIRLERAGAVVEITSKGA